MCVFLISPVPIAEPLTSELIDTPVFYNLAPRPIKYRVSVPIPNDSGHTEMYSLHFPIVEGIGDASSIFFYILWFQWRTKGLEQYECE